jgi:hypothetical protein
LSPGLWIRIVLMRIRSRIQLKILNADPDPDPDPGGGGRSAKNVHPPWQNPRYAPEDTYSKEEAFRLYCSYLHLMNISLQNINHKPWRD